MYVYRSKRILVVMFSNIKLSAGYNMEVHEKLHDSVQRHGKGFESTPKFPSSDVFTFRYRRVNFKKFPCLRYVLVFAKSVKVFQIVN